MTPLDPPDHQPAGPDRRGRPPSRSELPVGYLAGEPLAGPADWWVETLASFMDDGFDTLIFWPVDATPEQVELLAREVAPQLAS